MNRKIYFAKQDEYQIVAFLDGLYPDGHLRQAKVNSLWELPPASGEDLSALMPPVLDRAFKGEL